jgi:hypothetical protein
MNIGKAGRFMFTKVMAGETYIRSVLLKRCRFAPQIITMTEDMAKLNFSPQ